MAYKKLPSLQLLLCLNDQISLVNGLRNPPSRGYIDTGCRCLVCQASVFGTSVKSPAMPGFLVNLPQAINCKSGPGIVYHITCMSKNPECKYAHYVGRAWSSNENVYPMPARWSNHKSHFKMGHNGCRLTDHLHKYHRKQDPQQLLKIVVLQSAATFEETKKLELYWTRKLFAFVPTGLNVREEE